MIGNLNLNFHFQEFDYLLLLGSSSQDGSASNINRFTEGEEIEVFSRASDQESCGWWRAIIKMIKGDFHVVEYLGWETTYTEIVTSDRLRSKSQEPPIDARTFVKFSIPLPDEIRDFYYNLEES